MSAASILAVVRAEGSPRRLRWRWARTTSSRMSQRGQGGEGVGQVGGLGLLTVVDGETDEGVEDVGAHPLVAVGGAVAADAGLGEPGGGAGLVATGGAEEAEAAGGQALPAGVAEVGGQRPGVLKLLGGGRDSALASQAAAVWRRPAWTSTKPSSR